MRKLVAIFLLCLFALLLIAAHPRPCRTRDECFFRFVFTETATQTPTQTPSPPAPSAPSACDASNPNPYFPGTCAHIALENALATWTAANCAAGSWQNGNLNCIATIAPPPVTAPPEGYP